MQASSSSQSISPGTDAFTVDAHSTFVTSGGRAAIHTAQRREQAADIRIAGQIVGARIRIAAIGRYSTAGSFTIAHVVFGAEIVIVAGHAAFHRFVRTTDIGETTISGTGVAVVAVKVRLTDTKPLLADIAGRTWVVVVAG